MQTLRSRFASQTLQQHMQCTARICALVIVAVSFVASVGCHLRLDQWPPGTIGNQRARAAVHDPFPSSELGPEIMGGRPLGFDLPASQSETLQDPQVNPYARRGGRARMPTGF